MFQLLMEIWRWDQHSSIMITGEKERVWTKWYWEWIKGLIWGTLKDLNGKKLENNSIRRV